jgi:hypothetical protein
MPDPFVIPAGVALAGFIMSALGWYGMVRNGIQMVHDDIKAAGNAGLEIEDALVDMTRHHDKLADWMRNWMISDDTPFSLYRVHWGDNYGDEHELQIRWYRLRETLVTAEGELRRFSVLRKESWLKLESRDKERLKKGLRNWLKLKRWCAIKRKTAEYIGAKRTRLHQLLADLASKLDGIDDAARRAWLSARGIDNLSHKVKREEIYHVGISHLLIPLAVTAWQVMDDPKAWLVGNEFRTDFELDVFGNSATSLWWPPVQNVITAAARGHIGFGVLTQRITRSPSGPPLSPTRCLRVDLADNGEEDQPLTGDDAFESVFSQNGRTRFAGTGGISLVLEPFKNAHPHGYPSRVRFWTLQRTGATDIVRLDHVDKCRVAFELAQMCLLSLGTAWFSGVGTCDLRCGLIPQGHPHPSDHEFALQFDRGNSCMCGHGSGDLPPILTRHTKSLRRLGLFLVEIWRVAPIRQVDWDDQGNITAVVLREEGSDTRYDSHRLFEHPSFPTEYRNAVRHCMTASFADSILPSPSALEEALQQLYEQTVRPSVHPLTNFKLVADITQSQRFV